MYPIADGNYVIYDLNTQPSHSLFEQEMFFKGLQLLPNVFLNLDIPYGVEDPKGVLRILLPLYTQITTQINDLFLQNPFYIHYFVNKLYANIHALMITCLNYEQCKDISNKRALFYELLQCVIETQGLMPINWLIPREQFGEWLGQILPDKSQDYIGNFSRLLVPNVEPHYLRVHRAFLTLERQYLMGEGSNELIAQFVDNYGFLYFEPVMSEEEMMSKITDLITDSMVDTNLAGLNREIEANDRVHHLACCTYHQLSQQLIEQADQARVFMGSKILLRSVLRLGRAITDQEEERRIWQNRFYRDLIRILKANSVRIEDFCYDEVDKLDFAVLNH